MADALGRDGNRVTFARTEGHQIRLITGGRVPHRIRVTCICQDRREAPWASASSDTEPDHWRLYNRLPHDPDAGPFELVDETTGEPLTPEVPHHVAE